jgi:polar amino acid transport system substrate-binding protein
MPRSQGLLFLLLASVPLMPAELAPSGTLRAVFLGNNPVQGMVDPNTGVVRGPAADIVKELARRAGVNYTISPAVGAKAIIERLNNGDADIGFLAWEAERARQVDFSIPYSLMGSSYLIPAGSPIHTVADADRAGLKIGAVGDQSPTIYLQEHLHIAKLITWPAAPPFEELQKMLANGEVDAFAGNRARLVTDAAAHPGFRVAQDNFTVLEQAIVVRKGDTAKLKVVNEFLKEARGSSFVRDSLARAKLAGVEPEPPLH